MDLIFVPKLLFGLTVAVVVLGLPCPEREIITGGLNHGVTAKTPHHERRTRWACCINEARCSGSNTIQQRKPIRESTRHQQAKGGGTIPERS